ncbi:hypothetical protein RJ639_013531 [Escallonia herrerae]|uniref:Uncharacterized protein n=1 Tax=Escallonia herrerae TaxID=1293975 RepID=A0AA88VHS9_9ASTE|nr:hypothetical protein RJ639_013531 [Escallonia herrerae]
MKCTGGNKHVPEALMAREDEIGTRNAGAGSDSVIAITPDEILRRDDEEKRSSLRDSIAQIIAYERGKQQGGQRSSKQSPYRIGRIPQKLRQVKESIYSPRAVSIGPLHSDAGLHLKEMEDYKKTYMHYLFYRTLRSEESVNLDIKKTTDECVNAMLQMVPRARDCYEEGCFAKPLDDIRFAHMMLLDGCFIIEFLYRYKLGYKHSSLGEDLWYDGNRDPIFGNTLVRFNVIRDMLLVENQIPFFVLGKLFQLTVAQIKIPPGDRPPLKDDTVSLTDLVLHLFVKIGTFGCMPNRRDEDTETILHMLDLLHKCYMPSYHLAKEQTKYPITNKYSATQLDKVGVNFKAIKGRDGICVQFNEPKSCLISWLLLLCSRPRLEIPTLRINGSTEPILRNLVAFEQCCPYGNHHHITSYVFLMDSLINSKEDFDLLEDAKVVVNNLPASVDPSDLFKNICKEVVLGDFSFTWECWKADQYCYTRLASVRHGFLSLTRYYFTNRWAFISIVAALILFTLQVIQTIYTGHTLSSCTQAIWTVGLETVKINGLDLVTNQLSTGGSGPNWNHPAA